MNALRWAAVLPAAAFGAWLVFTISHLGSLFGGLGPDDWRLTLFELTAGHAVLGASFIYIGSRTAPHHRKLTAFCLGSIALVGAGAALLAAVIQKDWAAATAALSLAVGSGLTLYAVHSGELPVGE